MFADEALSDIVKFSEGINKIKKPDYEQRNLKYIIDLSLDGIKSAQRFEFGEVKDFSKKAIKNGGRVFIDNSEFLKMPFEKCWFEFYLESPTWSGRDKFGAIVQEGGDDFLFIFMWIKSHDQKIWLFLPYMTSVSIGKPLNEIDSKPILKIIKKHTPPNTGKDNILYTKIFRSNSFSYDDMEGMGVIYLSAIHAGLLLLNCKNITTEKIYPPEKLNKKRIRSGKQPLLDYHILKIKSSTGPSPKQNGIKNLWTNRVHFCRGHFKRRKTGLYWWNSQVRGNPKKGMILKDYDVSDVLVNV